MNHAPVKFEVANLNGLGANAFTRKCTQDNAPYPLHHVTYATTKFAMSSGLGEDSFTNIYILKVIL